VSAAADARAKERRQKIIAGVGGAVLVVVLLIQGPKTLKRFSGSAAAAPPATAVSPAPAAPQPSSSSGGSQSLAAVLAAEQQVVRSISRLYAFDRFTYKDPFAEPGGRVHRDSVRTRRGAPAKPSRRRPARRLRFTVIVHSLPVSFGRKRAVAIARQVSRRLGRRARVLRSSTQRSLSPGYYVVHMGSFRSRAAARPALRAAERINRRAYIRHIIVR
jgi:hypothetical protein